VLTSAHMHGLALQGMYRKSDTSKKHKEWEAGNVRGWTADFRATGCHSAVVYCSSSAVTLCWQKSARTLICKNQTVQES